MSGLRIDWLEAPEVPGEPAAALPGEVAWFERSERGERILGLGVARVCAARNLAGLARVLEAQAPSFRVVGEAQLGGAVWLGTALFDPVREGASSGTPGARFVLPRVAFLTRPFDGPVLHPLWWKNFGPDYNRATAEAAAELGLPLVDVYSYFKGRDEYFADESHFTRAGHELAGRWVATDLMPLMAAREAR